MCPNGEINTTNHSYRQNCVFGLNPMKILSDLLTCARICLRVPNESSTVPADYSLYYA